METPDNRFSELVDLVKSWIPQRPKPANVSRAFWMPDHICRVCYECDSQFTVFNRRHHCRLCGRVFCGRCTANSVSVSSDEASCGREEGEKIRACNFCFKQWEQSLAGPENGNQASSPGLSSSPSATSLVSIKSSGTAHSSNTIPGSMSYTTSTYQRAVFNSGLGTPGQSAGLEPYTDRQDLATEERNMDSPIAHEPDPPRNSFGFCMNSCRSDDEEDEYACRSDSDTRQFHHRNDYYVPDEFDEVDHGYRPENVHPSKEDNDQKYLSSPQDKGTEFETSLSVNKMVDESGGNNMDDCDTSSSIYNMESADSEHPDTEPVDFENNGLLWLPPDPEDGQDGGDIGLFDDDDEEDTLGEWGNLQSSNSFGTGEFRLRDRPNDDHRKAMKHVVDGHFRALISQLLQVENLPIGEENDKEGWLQIITCLSWEAATLLKPDTNKGDEMDPGGYLKIKCIAYGHRSESMVIKGIVCKKNVAHRRMTARIEKPRFLILGGALEYQRKANSLSSVDTLLQQETDHLKMAVAKIDAQHPNVLLVEKSVSRFAQECLLAKGISLVLNMKRPLLERIARCTGAHIVPSVDNLSSQMLGYCDSFHVEKLLEEHGSAGQGGKKLVKTLMFFEGCPRPLGCTVLLKGASGDELKKVKHVIQYGVFAAYHLALETSFLADEGASLSELPLNSPIAAALRDKPSTIQRSISVVPGFTIPTGSIRKLNSSVQMVNKVPDLDPITGPNEGGRFENPISPHSSQSHFQVSQEQNSFPSAHSDAESFSLEKGSEREQETEVHVSMPSYSLSPSGEAHPRYSTTCDLKESIDKEHFGDANLKTDFQTATSCHTIPSHSPKALESLESVHSAPNGAASEGKPFDLSRSQSLQRDGAPLHDHSTLKEDFPPSPSDHQSILVSLSTRCVWKGTVCERAHLFRIKYYGSFDKPLGRFLRDHLFDQGYRCRSCEMPSEAHVHCYTHRQGSLIISVKKLSELPLTGERDGKIWMWHRCLRCPRVNKIPPATRRVVMSDAAWGLSFGKFLELSFSNHSATSRVASCGHSLHRDCLRFYGFGKMVACFRYASIDVHSVYLPPSKLDFNRRDQDWVLKEAEEVVVQGEQFFSEVHAALQQIAGKQPNTGSPDNGVKVTESTQCMADLQGNLQKEKAQFEESLQRVMRKGAKKGQSAIDILEINKLRRQLLLQSYVWDRRLVSAASMGNASPLGHSASNLRGREKVNSTEKPLELTEKPVDHEGGSRDLPCANLRVVDSEVRDAETDNNRGKQSQRILPYGSADFGDQLGPAALSAGVVRRAHSEGQFSTVIANLSDSLDAKWTGENGSAPAATAAAASEAGTAASSVTSETATEVLSDDRGVPDMADRDASWEDQRAEDVSKWIRVPFTGLYQSFNKVNSVGGGGGGALGLHSLGDYSPIFIPSFVELERHGGSGLLMPVGVNDTVVPVYDDEPTSIISYALVSPEYLSQMADDRERVADGGDPLTSSLPSYDSGSYHPFRSLDEISSEYFSGSVAAMDEGARSTLALDPLLYTKALHIRVSFADEGPRGKVKYTVTCYYAKRFEALRRTCCPSELDFVRSLSRCKKWGAQGGKSNVFFAKSLDERFIIKQVTKTELESFIKFAPEYFKYLSESISTGSPTCLAKILGIYQVATKQLKGGKETKMDVLVMENLLFGRSVVRLYDLKGSSRSRYNADSSGSNKVLLDQNLIESMPTSPIFVGNKAKRLLERAVWNDTAFLASIDVMDYSLLVGVDEEKQELVLGIIDFMRQYTWDKHLETWVKASGILGGPKNVSPTVISPKQYKKRFRKAMSAYFLMVPDQWSLPIIVPSRSQSDLCEDSMAPLPSPPPPPPPPDP